MSARRKSRVPSDKIKNRTVIIWCDEQEHANFHNLARVAGYKVVAHFARDLINEGWKSEKFAAARAALAREAKQ